jgi:hypothetical protein
MTALPCGRFYPWQLTGKNASQPSLFWQLRHSGSVGGDRCNMAFGRQPFRKPAFMLVRNTVLVVEALLYRTTSSKKAAKLLSDNQVLLGLVSQFIRSSSFG